MKVTCERYHDISVGHRVVGHENKCRHLHGHNYRITFTCEAETLDNVGRTVDFGVIKSVLCEWLEEHWDHRMLLWEEDPMLEKLRALDPSVTAVPFNPTAENMASYLLDQGFDVNGIPQGQLDPVRGLQLIKVRVEETRKCSAEAVYDRT